MSFAQINCMRARPIRAVLFFALATAGASGLPAQALTPPDTSLGCQWREECSTPGAMLRMAERAHSGTGRDAKVDVSPHVGGLPANVPLTFWLRRLGKQPSLLATGYAFDTAGKLRCADRAANAAMAAAAGTSWCPARLDTLTLTLHHAMEGEPFAFSVSTADGRQNAYAVVVPRPIPSAATACGALDAQLLDADARVVRIDGRGFPPSTQVTTASVRGRDKKAGAVRSDSGGRFTAIVYSNGRGGDGSYTAQTAACTVTLPYRWGRSAW